MGLVFWPPNGPLVSGEPFEWQTRKATRSTAGTDDDCADAREERSGELADLAGELRNAGERR